MVIIGPTLFAQVESSAPIANYLVCCDLPTRPAPDLLYTGVELGVFSIKGIYEGRLGRESWSGRARRNFSATSEAHAAGSTLYITPVETSYRSKFVEKLLKV